MSQGNKDFILELSDKELKNLGEIRNEDILTTKRELKKKKREWIIKPVFYTGLLVAIVFIAFSSYNCSENWKILGKFRMYDTRFFQSLNHTVSYMVSYNV